MIKINANLVGVDKSNFSGARNKVIGLIGNEMNKFGLRTVNKAKVLSPVDEGNLRNAINYDFDPVSMTVTINVRANYAAFVEFGTRKFAAAHVATLPGDWPAFAAQYKGRTDGGTFEEFVMELVRWVTKKKIGATYNVQTRRRNRVGRQSAKTTAYADAYAIALYIIRNGIRPHPYLVPAVEENKLILLANLKGIIK